MPLRWKSSDTANILTLPSTWEAFRSGLKRNVKESLRHGYNSLKREGFEPCLGVAETAAVVRAALEAGRPFELAIEGFSSDRAVTVRGYPSWRSRPQVP